MTQDQKNGALEALVEEVATLLEATLRTEDGLFHLNVPIMTVPEDDEDADDEDEGADDEGENANEGAEASSDKAEADDEDEDEGDGVTFQVAVALGASEDGSTLFVTRRLCAYHDLVDLAELLRALSGTIHVQLAIDDDDDIVLSAATPTTAPVEWIADIVGEIAEFAPDFAEDATAVEESA